MQTKNLFSLSLYFVFLIFQPFNKVSANPVDVTVNRTTYSVTWEDINFTDNRLDFNTTKMPWWGDEDLAGQVANAVGDSLGLPFYDVTGPFFAYEESPNYSITMASWFYDAPPFVAHFDDSPYPDIVHCKDFCITKTLDWPYATVTSILQDDGDATYTISGTTTAGQTLSTSATTNDPDGNGTTSSYVWQSSSDGRNWTTVGTSAAYTLTTSEEGKYIRVIVTYTDAQNFSESVVASAVSISQLHTEWLQPYAAMQNVGLKSIYNNRDLVLAKAGECNNYGWVIGDTDYCVYTNAKNKVSYVNGETTRGSYGAAVFNRSINVEKTINDKWKVGVAYGMGTANLYDFNFSGTTANLNSSNNHYSVYGVKKVNDKFTLKGMFGGSVFDYKGKRNYSTTSAASAYETNGYTAEINAIWDIKKSIKNMKTLIRLQPALGVAFAAHAQDGFSESGSGDLITVDPNQAEQLLFKTGIGVDKEIIMEGGKWLLVPSLALNYEMDIYAGKRHRDLKGGLTESSTAHTSVEAKTFGKHRGSVKLGTDFVCTKDFMFNLNAEYGLVTNGNDNSYGGGFRWQF